MKKRIYLAAPYSHPDKKIREWRVEQVNRKAADLMMQGYLVFSPLSHSKEIEKYCKADPCDHDFWIEQCLWILSGCDEFHVLCLPGWEDSKGVKEEDKRADIMGLKFVYHDWDIRQEVVV